MAYEGINKQPLVPALTIDPTPESNAPAPTRRRYRRARSVPVRDSVPQEQSVSLFSPFQSILNKIHPSFRQVVILLAAYLGIGSLCFYLTRHQIKGKKTGGVFDAVYFCIVTMTTVGYGDLVPNSVATKLLACAFVFTGMALVGMILNKSADYLVEKQEILLIKALHMHQKVRPTELSREMESYRSKYKCFLVLTLLLLLMTIGTIFLIVVEKLSFVDAFYCVCSTITTLGYGDKSFSTKGGRIFAVFWIICSTIVVALSILYIAELSTERRQKSLVKLVLSRRMTIIDLEAADFDYDGVVSASEFVIYKLKEMGKISEEDISLIMEQFEELDVDQTGTLSASDIVLADTSETAK